MRASSDGAPLAAQAWLAAHGRPLREAVAGQRLWERALEALPVATAEELGSSWDAASRQTAADYRAACRQVHYSAAPPQQAHGGFSPAARVRRRRRGV